MTKINTVLGSIEANELGVTLMHEHLSIVDPSMRNAFPNWFNKEEVIKNAVKDVIKAKEVGVKTIVEVTPLRLGRDLSIIKKVAELTGINIITATGMYWSDEPWTIYWEPEQIAEKMIQEITIGIEETNVKPGIIKAGTELQGVTTYNYKALQTVAILHLKTGLPITTHASVINKIGLLQQDIFESAGVDLSKVIIGHCGDTADISYIEKILERGSYVGLDRFGLETILPDNLRIKTLVELCKRGYAERIVLSHDYCSFVDFVPSRKIIEDVYPTWHLAHLHQDIIPEVKKQGVTQAQIDTMLIDNPKRILSL